MARTRSAGLFLLALVVAGCTSPALTIRNDSLGSYLVRMRLPDETRLWSVNPGAFGVALGRVPPGDATFEVLDSTCAVVATFMSADGGSITIDAGGVHFDRGPQRLGDGFALDAASRCP